MTRQCLELLVECLDARLLLAGNVDVFMAGGDLVVLGDNLDNEIEIEQTGAGAYTVTGVAGTTIDGFGAAIVSGVHDDFVIRMRGGDDVVKIVGNTEIPDDLTAFLDAGNDQFRISDSLADSVVIGDDVKVFGAFGVDEVEIWYSTRILGDLQIVTGPGDDVVEVWNDSQIDGRLDLRTGSGADLVQIWNNSRIEGRVNVAMGSGADEIQIWNNTRIGGRLNVAMGSGNDEIQIWNEAELWDDVNLRSAGGNDDVDIRNQVHIAGKLLVQSAGGDDLVRLGGGGTGIVIDGRTDINTGGGNDVVSVLNTHFGDDMKLLTAGGEDDVEVCVITFSSDLLLNGGSRDDRLDTTLIEGGPVTFKNFETTFICV